MPIPELVKFREKYPQYNDLDDTTIANKLAQKYPEAYGDLPVKIRIETPSTQSPPQQQKPLNFIQRYLQEAQPAFKLALRHPETFLPKSGGISAQEIERTGQLPWADIYRESGLPFSKSTSTAGQLIPQAAGLALDIGTRPSSYIGSYLAPKAASLAATTPMTRRFMQTQLPTLSKSLLEANPVEPVYRTIRGMQVDIMKPLPRESGYLVKQGQKLVDSVHETIGNMRQQFSSLLKPFYDAEPQAGFLKILPQNLLKELEINPKTATVGQLWEGRWTLLKQLNESAFTKDELLKRTRLSEDTIMNALTRLKAIVLNSVDDTTRSQIEILDPQFEEINAAGKGLLGIIYNPKTKRINTNALVAAFKNPNSEGTRELFNRFGYFDRRINDVAKTIKGYAFRQNLKRIMGRVGMGAAIGGVGYSVGSRMGR